MPILDGVKTLRISPNLTFVPNGTGSLCCHKPKRKTATGSFCTGQPRRCEFELENFQQHTTLPIARLSSVHPCTAHAHGLPKPVKEELVSGLACNADAVERKICRQSQGWTF